MFDDRSGVTPSAPAFPSVPPFQAAITMPSRERFYVELKPGETTFVSWKKLLKDFHKAGPPSSSEAPVGAHPALEARIAPEVVSQKDPLPPPPNRFNSVIEKIERIYKGGNSSDENENLSDFPDDDEYDTEDSFIDDTELNEYFSVDKAKTKHNGFFVNRGKLEREAEPSASPVIGPKKRKRRDIKKLSNDKKENNPEKLLKSGVRLKAAARKVPLSTVGVSASFDEAFLAVSDSNKQTPKKERKEARDPLQGNESGKGAEEDVSGSGRVNTAVNNVVVSQYTNDVVRDGTEGREAFKSSAVERSMDPPSNVNWSEFLATEKSDANGLVKRDCLFLLEQKDALVPNLTKMKAAQKGIKDEESREVMGVSGKLHAGNAKSSPPTGKDVSPGRPKGTVLERAFQDLERGVAQLCPPLVGGEAEQGKRNRLPRDIKQKLAKVARLAAKQGRINDELIERLMGILGHVMRVKTLKRNLKSMIEMGLSAMQEKEGRLQDIKREVTEMVKSRVHTLQAQEVEQHEVSSDDFQPVGSSADKTFNEVRYQWDHATEDKICDLYEQYIEGMDEHRGPQIRKLYAELAELWPNGWMDNIGIKHAVHRAKERKKQRSKASKSREESRKRRRSSGKQKVEELGSERISLLELNPLGQEHYPYHKIRSHDFLENEMHMNYGNEAHPSYKERRKYSRKCPGKGIGSIDKKRSKVEGSPLLKTKIKRKLEKGVMDAIVGSKKSGPTHPALVSSAKEMSLDISPLNVSMQPGVALPVTE